MSYCPKCKEKGMTWNSERKTMVLCSCELGEKKRRWFDASPAERERAMKERQGRKKR